MSGREPVKGRPLRVASCLPVIFQSGSDAYQRTEVEMLGTCPQLAPPWK